MAGGSDTIVWINGQAWIESRYTPTSPPTYTRLQVAKFACEAHWQERLGAALEEVSDNEKA